MNATRSDRHRIISELLQRERIGSQDDLLERLGSLGLEVTQATVSRDLDQLGAIKLRRNGETRYTLPDDLPATTSPAQRLGSIVREWVRSVEALSELVVLKTPPGSAHLVGVALDQANLPEVAGTICGDDTIFIAVRPPFRPAQVAERLTALPSV